MINRVTILADCKIGGRGGSELHVKAVAEGLVNRGFAVQAIELAMDHELGQSPPLGAKFEMMPTGSLLSWHGLKRARQIRSLIAEFDSQAVISFFETSDIINILAGNYSGQVRRISSRRDTGFRHSKKMKAAYRIINPHFDEIIVPSSAVKESVIAGGAAAGKIRLAYNGVDLQRFKPADSDAPRARFGVEQDKFTIVSVAALTKVKDHSTLLAATEILKRRGVPVCLLMAGTGQLSWELSEEASRRGLEGNVKWLGIRSDIPELLAASDVFAMCSLTEGMSNSVLEAMAMAKPVVVTRVGGNPDLVSEGENGFLVPVKDPAIMADRLQSLFDSRLLAHEMGIKGRRRVMECFAVDTMVQQYVDALRGAAMAPLRVRAGGSCAA